MCVICERLDMWKNNSNPYFIHEFEHSIFVVGDHQFFEGYCLLLLKDHQRDITDLDLKVQGEFFKEVMIAGKVIQKMFKPFRMNYSTLGNVVEHTHFHVFPRYEEELALATHKDPWFNCEEFGTKKLTESDAIDLANKIRKELQDFL